MSESNFFRLAARRFSLVEIVDDRPLRLIHFDEYVNEKYGAMTLRNLYTPREKARVSRKKAYKKVVDDLKAKIGREVSRNEIEESLEYKEYSKKFSYLSKAAAFLIKRAARGNLDKSIYEWLWTTFPDHPREEMKDHHVLIALLEDTGDPLVQTFLDAN